MTKHNLVTTLKPKGVMQFLFGITACLLIANFAVLYFIYGLGIDNFYGLVPLFDFDMEKNIPTLFSVFLFLLNSVLFFIVWKGARISGVRHIVWLFLSIVFFFLAIDELSSVHEHLSVAISSVYKTSGVFHFAWVIPYSALVILLAFIMVPVLIGLNRQVRVLLIVSAVLFVSGALGIEMLGGKYFELINEKPNAIYGLITTLEELLEMSGLILCIYAQLVMLQLEFGGYTLLVQDNYEAYPIKAS